MSCLFKRRELCYELEDLMVTCIKGHANASLSVGTDARQIRPKDSGSAGWQQKLKRQHSDGHRYKARALQQV